MLAGDFTVCLMTLRQSVWGKGHFRELRVPAILHSEISGTGLGPFSLSSSHMVWQKGEEVRGVEESRRKLRHLEME